MESAGTALNWAASNATCKISAVVKPITTSSIFYKFTGCRKYPALHLDIPHAQPYPFTSPVYAQYLYLNNIAYCHNFGRMLDKFVSKLGNMH
jgi:hypothetical protein